MDLPNALATAGIGIVASAVTAYITVRINAKQERKRFEREIASKMAEFRNPPDDRTRIMAVQFAEGFLAVDRGSNSEREKIFLPSGCRITLGRDRYNHIIVDDPAVSRTHIAFRVSDSKVWLEPLAPTNPVCINGDPVSETKRLNSGDKVSIDCVAEFSLIYTVLVRS